ncbi:MAG TPA: efflux RND transporter periplasmic adaptor subunit [Planctomycetota bacterium]|nr:efflux RND transporter periplasmic adaptor subunit [Planctomycetota bacterium]
MRPSPPLQAARAAFTAAIAAVAASCGPSAPPAVPQRPPSPVAVARALSKDVSIYLDEIGRCVAREVVNLRAQVSGPIVEIAFTDGADVKKGDLLFRIDPRPFEARVAEAKAAVAQSKATLGLAKVEFERAKTLLAIDAEAIAKSDYDARESAVAVAEAKVAADEASVATAALQLDYSTLRSPIDGRAGQRLVDVGNVVKEQDTILVVLQRFDPIYADFTVAERDLDAVRRHLAESPLQARVWAEGLEREAREGPLTFVDSSVRDATGTVKLRATLANADRRFWPGQFVRVRLLLRLVPGSVLVPSAAIQIGQRGPYVWVVHEDSTAELRAIVPGQSHGDLIALDSGVRAGELVVTDGQITVVEGGKVHIVGNVETAASAASSSPANAPADADGQRVSDVDR